MELFGGIEAGGTKFVCLIGTGPDDIRAESVFPTTTPSETMGRAVAFFREHAADLPLSAVGVGCFGPVDLEPESPSFGHITTTPKSGWAGTDVVGMLRRDLHLPVAFDTDVNASAYAEYLWGGANRLDPAIYVTIGTGIGAGIVSRGMPVHGLVHPEAGHMRIPHDIEMDPFRGACPFHGDCFEGLASGTALSQRWKTPAETLPDAHDAWPLEAHYIGLALTNLILCHSPRRIVVGGGVMQRRLLFPMIQQNVRDLLNGYVNSPAILENIDQYVVPPALAGRAGALGAIALAQASLHPSP